MTIIKVLFVLLALSIVVPMACYYFGERKAGRFKKTLAVNLISFFGIMVFATVFIFSGNAYAADAATTAASSTAGMGYMAAALVTGFCTIGTGIATGQAAAAALGALSENDKIMGKALIFVALCEGIAIYGLLISFTILGRIS
jgi:V/A-type H+-transporting ATPase subunit K